MDFETTPAFNLTVEVEDGSGETDDATVAVNLNDLEATLSIDDTDVTEGNHGTATLGFAIWLGGDVVNSPFSVNFDTADGTALSSDCKIICFVASVSPMRFAMLQ